MFAQIPRYKMTTYPDFELVHWNRDTDSHHSDITTVVADNIPPWKQHSVCVCAYGLLQTDVIELFQFEQQFLLQWGLFSFQFIVSVQLCFWLHHIYTVTQLSYWLSTVQCTVHCWHWQRTKHDAKQHTQVITYSADVNVGHVGVARWGQRSSNDDDGQQYQQSGLA